MIGYPEGYNIVCHLVFAVGDVCLILKRNFAILMRHPIAKKILAKIMVAKAG